MKQEYRIGIWGKLVYGAIVIGIVFFSMFLLIKPSTSGKQVGSIVPVLLILSGTAILVSYIVKRKITISENHIEVRGAFRTRELFNSNVKGFRIVDGVIFIEPIQESYSRIRINDYTSIGDCKGLLENIRKVYVDLDAVSYQDNLNTILSDDKLWIREEDKLSKYSLSKRIALVYNCCGAAIFVLSLIFTDYILANGMILIILTLYPVIGFVLLMQRQGLIKVITKKNSAFSNIVIGLFLTIIILLVNSAIRYHVVSYNNIFLWVLIFGSMISVPMYRFGYDRSKNAVKGQIILLAIMALLYAWPVTLMINIKLDNSSAVAYDATVLDKYIYHNNNRNYYHFKLSQWNNNIGRPVDLQIDGGFYNKIKKGQSVQVNVKKGLLNIPWYYIKD